MANSTLKRFCYNCKTELTPLNDLGFLRRRTDHINFDGVLKIEFSGGWGGYIDGFFSIIICSDCAKSLRTIPFIDKALKEAEAY